MRALALPVAVIMLALAACENQPPPPVAPQIKLDKSSLGFGQEFGSGTYLGTSTYDTLIVMNEGQQDLVINSATKSGDTTGSFTITPNPPWPDPIPYNGQGFIRVLFRPRDAGVVTATLTIDSNAENAPSIDIALSGRGMTADGGQ